MNNPYNRPANSLVGLFIFLQQIAYIFFLHIFLQCLQNFPTEPTGFPTYTRAYTRTRTRTRAYAHAPAHAYTHENNIYTRDALTGSRDAVRACRSSFFPSRAFVLLSRFPSLAFAFSRACRLALSLFSSVRPLSLSLRVFLVVGGILISPKRKNAYTRLFRVYCQKFHKVREKEKPPQAFRLWRCVLCGCFY